MTWTKLTGVRFLLDAHVYDRLVETAERQRLVANLCRIGQIELLLMTHVQVDEIRDNPRTIADPATDQPIKVADAVLAIPFTTTALRLNLRCRPRSLAARVGSHG